MTCPKCKTQIQLLLFMGIIPEFLVCPKCKTAYTVNEEGKLRAVATVI